MATGSPPSDKNASASPANLSLVIDYEHTASFVPLLEQQSVSLLVSTYQAGKLVVVGVSAGELVFSFPSFEQAMGVAAQRGRLAVGSNRLIWMLKDAADLAPHLEPAGKHDACFVPRTAHFTGTIQGHELAWSGEELWVVNTSFSCLCTVHPDYSFVPRWRPPFISALAAEDRCHLNGFCLEAGQPRFVTALSETDTAEGWRPSKATSGCLIDVASGATVARGFAMPHSPRLHGGRLWLLDSGKGELLTVDPRSGRSETAARFPGYVRGLAFHGPYAFVGLSRIRDTSVFGGLPIAERRAELKCGVGVLDLRSGRLAAGLEFRSGVTEIFAVEVLPGVRCPVVSGPHPEHDGRKPIWLCPRSSYAAARGQAAC